MKDREKDGFVLMRIMTYARMKGLSTEGVRWRIRNNKLPEGEEVVVIDGITFIKTRKDGNR